MTFGHWIEIEEEGRKLRLGPIAREDMARYVSEEAGWGMQSYEVQKYLGRRLVQTPQSEEAWWDSVSVETTSVLWGVYVQAGVDDSGDGAESAGWKLIGSTGFDWKVGTPGRAHSGFVIFDRAYWRQGIAKTTHLARTMYAFDALDISAIDSGAIADNIGSNKALQSVGYVRVGTMYGLGIANGKVLDACDYLLVNPEEAAWNHFWRRPSDKIPARFHEARQITTAALARARQICHFL